MASAEEAAHRRAAPSNQGWFLQFTGGKTFFYSVGKTDRSCQFLLTGTGQAQGRASAARASIVMPPWPSPSKFTRTPSRPSRRRRREGGLAHLQGTHPGAGIRRVGSTRMIENAQPDSRTRSRRGAPSNTPSSVTRGMPAEVQRPRGDPEVGGMDRCREGVARLAAGEPEASVFPDEVVVDES